ncbi:MAG: hypothetical protein RSA56_05855 [Raoultibacter sp.]
MLVSSAMIASLSWESTPGRCDKSVLPLPDLLVHDFMHLFYPQYNGAVLKQPLL